MFENLGRVREFEGATPRAHLVHSKARRGVLRRRHKRRRFGSTCARRVGATVRLDIGGRGRRQQRLGHDSVRTTEVSGASGVPRQACAVCRGVPFLALRLTFLSRRGDVAHHPCCYTNDVAGRVKKLPTTINIRAVTHTLPLNTAFSNGSRRLARHQCRPRESFRTKLMRPPSPLARCRCRPEKSWRSSRAWTRACTPRRYDRRCIFLQTTIAGRLPGIVSNHSMFCTCM